MMTDETVESAEMPAKWPTDKPMGVSELTEFIAAFNESTKQLKQSHDMLRARVEELSGELRSKNEELSARVEEISSLKNYLANILESISDGVLAIDSNQQLVALNAAAAQLLPLKENSTAQRETDLHTLTAAARSLQAEAVMQSCNKELAAILIRAMEKEEAANNVEVEMTSEDGAQRSIAV
ncbi:MAG: PAS domain-containing protein, partial [Planctomycetes bacterium]|nr:PAS domain-containing protein [Planctomycetota bacterium]